MRWEAITPENVVAKLSGASEHAISDFKARYDFQSDPTKSFEIAKDVCAFANHLGGTIIVGAQEGKDQRRGFIDAFLPLSNPAPGDLVKEVDRVIRNLCLPVPIADPIPIELDCDRVKAILGRDGSATTIVAINVEPTLSGPIGCLACIEHSKACKDAGTVCRCNGMKVPDAWRFPIRVIEGTDLLRPDQIARRMNVNERRALLDVQAIVDEPKITVWFNTGDGKRGTFRPCRIAALDPTLMLCTLELQHSPDPNGVLPRANIPLTFVRATWQDTDGWHIAIDGIAFEQKANPIYREGFMPPGGIR